MTRERLEGMRDRIIPWITHKVKGISLPNYSELDREKVREELEELFDLAIKALEQEPKTGHWIKGYSFPDGAYWKCDKCNELIKVKIPMRYCNNCGAKMAETEDT